MTDDLVVLCSGSRAWTDEIPVKKAILRLAMRCVNSDRGLHVIRGDAKGLDTMVGVIATSLQKVYNVTVSARPAAWDEHHPEWCKCQDVTMERFCRRAGPRRNQAMLDEFSPSLLLAFTDTIIKTGPGGGTGDCVQRALKRDMDVHWFCHEKGWSTLKKSSATEHSYQQLIIKV